MPIKVNNRRDFLKLGGAAMGAASVSASSYASVLGANDRVRVGVIGCGDRMKSSLIPAFQEHAKDLNFELVAVSDLWNRRREEGAAYIQKLSGNSIVPLRNNDELYARKDIDAVLIATADFQHALHGVEAVNAGRDAYVEKPTAHTMDDARKFLAAVKKTGKIVQVGTQRRSTPSYQKAAAYIQSGKFAREWVKEYEGGYKKYNALLKEGEKHPIEKTGARLRGLMPWIQKKNLKGAQAAY